MTFKFLSSDVLAGALRAAAPRIELAAQGTLTLADGTGFYPGTSCHVTSLEAIDASAMVVAMRLVVAISAESGACVVDGGRELRFTVVMPSKSVSALIGVAGANVQALQKATGAHIHVDGVALGFGPSGDRAVNVHGGAPALESAVEKIIGLVQDFVDQPWFTKWAERTNDERLEALEAPPLPNQELRQLDGGRGGDLAGRGLGGGGGCCGGGLCGGAVASGSGLGGGCIGGGCGACGAVGCGGGAAAADPMAMMASMMGGMNPMMGMMNPMSAMMNPMMGMMMMNPMAAMMNAMMGGMGDMSAMGGMDAMAAMAGQGMGSELVMQAVKDLPPDVAADPRGFMLRCALPGQMVGPLVGQGGSGAREVQEFTGTRISIPGGPEDPTRIMSIEGPLLNVCAAYMLMMVRYINAEAEVESGQLMMGGMLGAMGGLC